MFLLARSATKALLLSQTEFASVVSRSTFIHKMSCPTKMLGGQGDRFKGHTVASDKSDAACTSEFLKRELKTAIDQWKQDVRRIK